jgi:hypothetical protein
MYGKFFGLAHISGWRIVLRIFFAIKLQVIRFVAAGIERLSISFGFLIV